MAVLAKGGGPKLKKMSTVAEVALYVEENGGWCCFKPLAMIKGKESGSFSCWSSCGGWGVV